jgi:hypothetical protein
MNKSPTRVLALVPKSTTTSGGMQPQRIES